MTKGCLRTLNHTQSLIGFKLGRLANNQKIVTTNGPAFKGNASNITLLSSARVGIEWALVAMDKYAKVKTLGSGSFGKVVKRTKA
jgi:hypothetical protein